MKKEIKLFVSGDATSCSQLRIKLKGDKYTHFICGIDVDERHVLTTKGHIWGYGILDLVRDIAQNARHEDEWEFRDLDRIEYLEVCDDSSNLNLDWEDCRNQLMKNKNAFNGMAPCEDIQGWVGVIEIYHP